MMKKLYFLPYLLDISIDDALTQPVALTIPSTAHNFLSGHVPCCRKAYMISPRASSMNQDGGPFVPSYRDLAAGHTNKNNVYFFTHLTSNSAFAHLNPHLMVAVPLQNQGKGAMDSSATTTTEKNQTPLTKDGTEAEVIEDNASK